VAEIGTSYSPPKALALHLKDIEKNPPTFTPETPFAPKLGENTETETNE